MKKKILNLIIVICLFSFAFFTIKIFFYVNEDIQEQELSDNIINVAIKASNQEEKENSASELVQIDFEALKNINTDIVAWIYSENTPINYPIVQANDNEYYLNKLVNGANNKAGTLFIDYKNNNDFSDLNTIVYGHNMKNNTMFGSLINYKEQDYYDKHKEMHLYTRNKKYKVKIFAGYSTTSESDIYSFPKTKDTNKKMIEEAFKKSTFISNIDVLDEDSIITLSTCSYNFENERYVILGILQEI